MTYRAATGGVIRLSDGAFIPSSDGNRDYLEYLQWLDTGGVPAPAAPVSTAELIDAQWRKADSIARLAIDDNARARYLAWLIDGNDAQKAMVRAVQVWADTVWQSYAVVKAALLAGDASATIPDPPPCPYDFWTIAGAT